jgi:hypothetical protein
MPGIVGYATVDELIPKIRLVFADKTGPLRLRPWRLAEQRLELGSSENSSYSRRPGNPSPSLSCATPGSESLTFLRLSSPCSFSVAGS